MDEWAFPKPSGTRFMRHITPDCIADYVSGRLDPDTYAVVAMSERLFPEIARATARARSVRDSIHRSYAKKLRDPLKPFRTW
jgi:anti-sigma factor RsiW